MPEITLTAGEDELARTTYLPLLEGTLITLEAAELAERTLAWIIDHPGAHRQFDWFQPGFDSTSGETVDHVEPDHVLDAIDCGTKACYAGWMAVLDGHTIGLSDDNRTVVDNTDEPIAQWALARLNLPAMMAHRPHPFHARTTLSELKAWVWAFRLRAELLTAQATGKALLRSVSS